VSQGAGPVNATLGGRPLARTLLRRNAAQHFAAAKRELALSDAKKTGPVTIKKYANRRLYNTATSSYVTLDHLSDMVRKGTEFAVYDAKSGEDITRSVLAQIIFEEENKEGQNLLPVDFLRQLIRFYGDSMQGMIPSYLQMSLQMFAQQQDQLRTTALDAMTGKTPVALMEDQLRANMAMFQKAWGMFTPFSAASAAASPPPPAAPKADDMAELKAQLSAMQKRLDAMEKG
jgi:polyhydroxyalkanoate synthesis repressor PhaR